jgi:hypothetical protein
LKGEPIKFHVAKKSVLVWEFIRNKMNNNDFYRQNV